MPAAVEPEARRRFVRPLAALCIAYTLVLVFATHYPEPEDLLGPTPPSDKTLHLAAYGTLGLLVAATLAAAGRLGRGRGRVALLAAALAGFAAVDEATQPLFGRSADVWDWLADCVGLAGGIAVVLAACAWLPRRRAQ